MTKLFNRYKPILDEFKAKLENKGLNGMVMD